MRYWTSLLAVVLGLAVLTVSCSDDGEGTKDTGASKDTGGNVDNGTGQDATPGKDSTPGKDLGPNDAPSGCAKATEKCKKGTCCADLICCSGNQCGTYLFGKDGICYDCKKVGDPCVQGDKCCNSTLCKTDEKKCMLDCGESCDPNNSLCPKFWPCGGTPPTCLCP